MRDIVAWFGSILGFGISHGPSVWASETMGLCLEGGML